MVIAAFGNEFSRPIAVEKLGDDVVGKHIEADSHERQALAQRLGLLGIKSLRAELGLRRPRSGPLVHIEGRFEADVSQTCVVSLEPVESHIREAFRVVFTSTPADDEARDLEFSLADEDLPEPLEGGLIDMGETVVQQLAVALDPYPRHPDAALAQAELSEHPVEPARGNPFDVLRVETGGEKS